MTKNRDPYAPGGRLEFAAEYRRKRYCHGFRAPKPKPEVSIVKVWRRKVAR